jgi:hypothetical protein
MELGLNLCLGMDDGYDTVEEFYAILIANIYLSESVTATCEPTTMESRCWPHP